MAGLQQVSEVQNLPDGPFFLLGGGVKGKRPFRQRRWPPCRRLPHPPPAHHSVCHGKNEQEPKDPEVGTTGAASHTEIEGSRWPSDEWPSGEEGGSLGFLMVHFVVL